MWTDINIASLFGTIDKYDSSEEEWSAYGERCEQCFVANDIEDDKKKVDVLLSSFGLQAYQDLSDTIALQKPRS